MKKGKVYLVGAGPGDPALITLAAKRCLEKVDVVIYDYLTNPELLKYTKRGAELICADKLGKRFSNGSLVAQKLINQLIVSKAKEGKIVVRLKGGDPFIFGRGGEEAEILVKNKIPFEVTPGITAAAGLAYAGFPLTHRKFASSVSLITGHEDPSKDSSSIDWDRISKSGTLVFYMGVENLPKIVKRLIKAGRSLKTPVALVEWITRGRQRTIVGRLTNIVQKAKRSKITPPALIVVGEVITLRKKLNWFEKKPLFGKKILVTRTREQASSLSELLYDLGADVIEFPTIEVIPTNNQIPDLEKYDWLIFTSENGVKFFFEKINEIRDLYGKKICAIGPATAQVLRKHKITVDLMPSEYQAEGIIDAFKNIDITGKNILIPRAEEARNILELELKNMGAKIDILPIYKTIKPKQKINVDFDGIDIITFTSSSTVKNFVKMVGSKARKAKIACIGPITAATAIQLGFKVNVMAKENTIDGLVKAIINDRRN